MQTTLVASPRNHLYRTPIGTIFSAFWPTGKADHVGDPPTSSIVKPSLAALMATRSIRRRRISIASDRGEMLCLLQDREKWGLGVIARQQS
jgi:hypothetical protein